jgi:hypothetical protein
MQRIWNLLVAFGVGYFFGLGLLALAHAFLGWPDTYEQGSIYALLSGAGALITRIYNERVGRGAGPGA